jgi:hypothetical protein
MEDLGKALILKFGKRGRVGNIIKEACLGTDGSISEEINAYVTLLPIVSGASTAYAFPTTLFGELEES